MLLVMIICLCCLGYFCLLVLSLLFVMFISLSLYIYVDYVTLLQPAPAIASYI